MKRTKPSTSKNKNSDTSKKIVVCGDSFAVGIGCRDLINEPFGSLVAKELNRPLVNLAKGSSTNLSIFLQMQYVADKLADTTEIALIGNTSYDRVEWFPLDTDFETNSHRAGELTNEMVNYHQYPPYGPHSYWQTLPNPMADDPDYTGKMFTENYMGVIDYWQTFGKKRTKPYSDYYKRFDNEPKQRMKTLYDFAVSVHEPRINRIYSIGVLAMGHQRLKQAGIKHLIFSHEVEKYSQYIDPVNLVNVNWGQLSLDYPDDIPSWHTSAEGQRVVYETVMKKLKENGWV
jgi:hypothetical protein